MSVDQKKIAKNTLLLYVRMGLIMLVSLYTSRVVLDALGEVDFGIYNAVGGIVMMLSFLSNTMSTACQRFYSVEIGRRGDFDELHRTFSLCVLVFVAIIVVITLLAEGFGIWLMNSEMKFEGRESSAMWVFQCSVVSFAFTIMRTPYMGMIVAKERMKVYTYLSVIEVAGNLAIALLIMRHGGDRLIFYSVLMLFVNFAVSMFYIIYCRVFYKECKFSFYWDTRRFKEILGFAGWNMIGSLSGLCKSHGLNILLNMFFGPAVNAARGMAYKVYATVQQFIDNFFMAVRPQMIKSYSSGDNEGMLKLLCQSSKFSYFLMFAISLPMFLETPFLLDMWLKNVPEYTVLFTRLSLINALVESLANPLATAMQAYGKIRNYHLACGGFTLLVLPASYVLLIFGFPPETVFVVSIIICSVAILIRLLFVRKSVGLSAKMYFCKAIMPMLIVTIVSAVVPSYLEMNLCVNNIAKFFYVLMSSLVMSCMTMYFAGLTKNEQDQIKKVLSDNFRKMFNDKIYNNG